jgi:hypothetical protein
MYFPLCLRITERADREYGPAIAGISATPLTVFALFIVWHLGLIVAGMHKEATAQLFAVKRSPFKAIDANKDNNDVRDAQSGEPDIPLSDDKGGDDGAGV